VLFLLVVVDDDLTKAANPGDFFYADGKGIEPCYLGLSFLSKMGTSLFGITRL
jgi:hypothetical protein